MLIKMIKRNVISVRFLIVVILYVCLCMCAQIPGENDLSIFFAAVRYTKAQMNDLGFGFDAFLIFSSFRDFEWYVVVLPMLTTLISIFDLHDNYFSNLYYLNIYRTKRKKYAADNVAETIILGMLVNFVGLILFMMIVFIKFPIKNGLGISVGEQIKIVSAMCIHITILTMLMTEIVILLLVLFKSPFYALTIPMMVNFGGYKILNFHQNVLIEKYGFDYPRVKLWPEIFNPAWLISSERAICDVFLVSPIVFYILFVVAILFCFGLLCRILITREKIR